MDESFYDNFWERRTRKKAKNEKYIQDCFCLIKSRRNAEKTRYRIKIKGSFNKKFRSIKAVLNIQKKSLLLVYYGALELTSLGLKFYFMMFPDVTQNYML